MKSQLIELVPSTKYEVEKAAQLVQLGWPEVAPVMPKIVEWLQDPNWPVAQVFFPFAASVGTPMAPYLREVLSGQDNEWKYSLLEQLVSVSEELQQALLPELNRLAAQGNSLGQDVDLRQLAGEILKARSSP